MTRNSEKIIIGTPSYIIFFDNVRVDHLVKSFSVELSCDGAIGSANMELLYVPDLYTKKSVGSNNSISYEDGIENMTNCKIFVKHMFINKYLMIFDGNIKMKSLSKSQGSYTLSFAANDYLTWLNKTVVALAIPLDDSLSSGDKLKWKAQGIDPQDSSIAQVTTLNDNNFRGKNLKEIVEKVVNQTLVSNKIYTDTNSVSVWDDAISRIALMGDIDENLRAKKVLDFVVNSSTVQVSSIYVMINDLLKNLLFEFYQDRDGIIRIKPPYWNEKLLKDHIIDPSLIMSYMENVNWNNYYTRIVSTGGLEEWEEGMDNAAKSIVTPVVAYALTSGGGIYADYLDNASSTTSQNTSGWPNVMKTGSNGEYVKQLQTKLNDLGFSPGSIDGKFGPQTALAVKNFQKSKGLKVDGIVGPQTKAALGVDGSNSGTTNVGGDSFLQPTDIEKKYGITVYEASQPLIKFSNAGLIDQTSKDAADTLKKYSQFMIGLLNSAVSVATVQTVAMPWIRPGFNAWIDPVSIDKVFYVSAVSHQGTAEGGVYTTLRLSMGRQSNDYCGNVNTLGAMRQGTSTQRDNIFINQIYDKYEPENFGDVIYTASDFNGVRTEFSSFYDDGVESVIYSDNSTHFQKYYKGYTTSSPSTPGSDSGSGSSVKSDKYSIDIWPSVLRRGNKNSSVKLLQQFLTDYGFNPGGIDSSFGPKTQAAVKRFQTSAGCRLIDGIVGSETKGAARTKEGYSKGSSTNTSTTTTVSINTSGWVGMLLNGSTGVSVKELQTALTSLGYSEVGSIDGRFGPKTNSAVKHFQQDKGIKVDGVVGPITKSKLQEALSSTSSTTSTTSSSSASTPLGATSGSTPKILSGEYTAEQLQGVMNNLYDSAPQVVKTRAARLKTLITDCETYVKSHYIKES